MADTLSNNHGTRELMIEGNEHIDLFFLCFQRLGLAFDLGLCVQFAIE